MRGTNGLRGNEDGRGNLVKTMFVVFDFYFKNVFLLCVVVKVLCSEL